MVVLYLFQETSFRIALRKFKINIRKIYPCSLWSITKVSRTKYFLVSENALKSENGTFNYFCEEHFDIGIYVYSNVILHIF